LASQLYDEQWHNWTDMKRYGPTSRHQRRLILDLLRPLEFESVIDVGCGAGDLLSELKQHAPGVKKFAGTDISQAALDISSQRLPEGTFTLLDMQTQTLQATYDLTIAVDVLEHVEDDEAMLRNICAITGKYFLAMTIQGNHLPEWEVEAVGHVRNYQYGELQSKITKAGFRVEQVVQWGFPFYSPLYRWIQARTAAAGTTGEYGVLQKLIAQAVYTLFRLNSSQRGDVILVLASVVEN
jgi:trans-aconitate methyltransferase